MFTTYKTVKKSFFAGLTLLSLCAVPAVLTAQDTTASTPATAPDNTSTNKVHHRKAHQAAHRQAADQQRENTPDRELTAKIRRSVVADKSISTYGHNVKIITANGAVTLKGPVHSEEEKKAIVAKAAEVVGQDKVTDQITVKQ